MPKALFLRGDGLKRRRFPGRNPGTLAGTGARARCRTQPFEGLHGGHGLFTASDTDGLGQREAPGLDSAAHIGAGQDPVFTGLQHPGGAEAAAPAVVIGGEQGERNLKMQNLGPAGGDQSRFREGEQNTGGLPERALGGAAVDLDDLLSRSGARVADRDRERNGLRRPGREGCHIHPEARIREAEAEGIEHLLRTEGLKVAVADIEVLGLDVLGLRAEAPERGPVLDPFGNGVRQAAGGADVAGEHVQHGIAALLTALPDIEHGGRVIFPDPAHVHDVPGVQKHGGPGKIPADQPQHVPLRVREQKAPRLRAVVLILAGGAPDQNQRGVGFLRRPADQLLGEGHLLLKPGFGGPALPGIEGVILQPGLIDGRERGVQTITPGLFQGVADPDHIVGVDAAAGTGAAFIIMKLGAAEKREALAVTQRERLPVIFQKDDALGGRPPRGGGIGRRIPMRRMHDQIPRNL